MLGFRGSGLRVSQCKVYALTKERDALRRGAERLTGINDLASSWRGCGASLLHPMWAVCRAPFP